MYLPVFLQLESIGKVVKEPRKRFRHCLSVHSVRLSSVRSRDRTKYGPVSSVRSLQGSFSADFRLKFGRIYGLFRKQLFYIWTTPGSSSGRPRPQNGRPRKGPFEPTIGSNSREFKACSELVHTEIHVVPHFIKKCGTNVVPSWYQNGLGRSLTDVSSSRNRAKSTRILPLTRGGFSRFHSLDDFGPQNQR